MCVRESVCFLECRRAWGTAHRPESCGRWLNFERLKMNRHLQIWFKIVLLQSGLSGRAFALKHGLSNAYVSRVIHHKRGIALETFERIARNEGFAVEWKLVQWARKTRRIVYYGRG